MGLSRQADILRTIATRLDLPDFRKLTQQPTINEAVRVSIYHHSSNRPDSVATLVYGHHQSTCSLHVCYDRPNRRADLQFQIPVMRYNALLGALRKSNFDHLDDESTLPFYGVDLWLIERAAGSFHHDVVLCPESATGKHRELLRALQDHLPEAVRVGA